MAINLRPCGDFRTTYKADQALFKTRNGFWFTLLTIVFFAVWALVSEDLYLLSLGVQICYYAIAALGLTLLVGCSGQISLGHAAFFGVGAYASAYLANNTAIPVILCIPLAGAFTAALGLFFGAPAARIRGLYLAIATFASQFILEDLFLRFEWLTGGSSGAAAPTVSIFGIMLDDDRSYFLLCLAFLVASSLLVSNMLRTRDGRAFFALRDHYLSAEVMGINLSKYRIMAFGISSFFAGIGGALFAHYLGFVSAEGFTIFLSIQFLAMVVIGGLGSVAGSLLGTIFIVLLPEVLELTVPVMENFLPENASTVMHTALSFIKEIAVGVVIVLFLIFEPKGIYHRWNIIRSSLRLYPFSH